MPPRKTQPTGLTDSWGRDNRQLPDYICAECGSSYHPKRRTSRYCSRVCMWKNNGGHNKKDEPSWWVDGKGYISGRVDGRRTRQHIYVMEQAIKRKLLPHETVHHLNGEKQDNRLVNLCLLTKTEHDKLHQSRRVYHKGYKLNLSDDERKARSDRMKAIRAKARGQS